MGALFRAELLAAQNGLATPIPVGQEQGFIVGGARDKALAAAPNLSKNEPIATPTQRAAVLYLAQQGAVRSVMDQARPSSAAPSIDLGGAGLEPAIAPVVAVAVTVAVVGAVALLVAGYAIGKASASETSAAAAARAGNIDRMIEAAQAGKPIDPSAWNAIAAVAKGEAEKPAIDWTTIAIVGAGAVGAFLILRAPTAPAPRRVAER
jgi:hypothetical protein